MRYSRKFALSVKAAFESSFSKVWYNNLWHKVRMSFYFDVTSLDRFLDEIHPNKMANGAYVASALTSKFTRTVKVTHANSWLA